MAVFQKGVFQGGGVFQLDWDKPLADQAVGADVLALLASIPGFDAAVGGEVVQLELPFADPGLGGESLDTLALVTLLDSAEGLEILLPAAGGVPVGGLDTADGADVLAVLAQIEMFDSAVGGDDLTRTFEGGTKPPRPGGGGGSSARAYIEKGAEGVRDEATGEDFVTVLAALIAKDKAAGKDEIAVDKHYPQLAAFHLLLAC